VAPSTGTAVFKGYIWLWYLISEIVYTVIAFEVAVNP